jgi:hypothetical protein
MERRKESKGIVIDDKKQNKPVVAVVRRPAAFAFVCI